MRFSLAAAVLLTLYSSRALADEPPEIVPPPPGGVAIERLTYGGTGCPAGTVSVDLSRADALRLTFSDFVARKGAGIPLQESRKNCQLNVSFVVPDGYSYAFASVEPSGQVSLQEGAKAMLRTQHYAAGQGARPPSQRDFTGPTTETWSHRHEVPADALVWSPCNVDKAENFNIEARVTAGSGSLAVSDLGLVHAYSLVWRRCPPRAHIERVSFTGNGCPEGSGSATLDRSSTRLVLDFEHFVAERGPDVRLSEARKYCKVSLELDAPREWTFAIAVSHRSGHASVAPGAVVSHETRHYFSDTVAAEPVIWRDIPGPYDNDWQQWDDYGYPDSDRLKWAPCGPDGNRELNIVEQLRVAPGTSAPDSRSFIGLDNDLSELQGQIYFLVWKACPRAAPAAAF